MVGNWALRIALPIHVYEQTGSMLATSGVVAAGVVPAILLGTVAGVFVDRWNRKTTLVVANVLLALATLPLVAVGDSSTIWLVYPVVLGSSTLALFTMPAENAFLPRLVEEDQLLAAHSLNALNDSLARLIGPAAGGALVALTGLAGVVVFDVASFLVAAALIAAVRTSGEITEAGEATTAAMRRWRRMWHEWREGIALVGRERPVRVIFVVAAITAVGEGVFAVMFVVWVREILEGGALELGWLQTSQAVGGLIGGAVGGWVGARLAPARLFAAGLIAFGIFDLALFNYPLLFSGVWLGLGLMVLVGAPGVWILAAARTILQMHVVDAYRGRIFAALGTTAGLLMLVGTVAAGVAGGFLGPIVLLNIQGGAYVAAGLFVLTTLSANALPHPSFASPRATRSHSERM